MTDTYVVWPLNAYDDILDQIREQGRSVVPLVPESELESRQYQNHQKDDILKVRMVYREDEPLAESDLKVVDTEKYDSMEELLREEGEEKVLPVDAVQELDEDIKSLYRDESGRLAHGVYAVSVEEV